MKGVDSMRKLFLLLTLCIFATGCGSQNSTEIDALYERIEELEKQVKDTSDSTEGGLLTKGETAQPDTVNSNDEDNYNEGRGDILTPESYAKIVSYPPSRKLACVQCEEGTISPPCFNCDGTGKSGEDTPSSYLDDFPTPPGLAGLDEATSAIVSRCLLCGGSGIYKCNVCWGYGEYTNPDYHDYVLYAVALYMETGETIFPIENEDSLFMQLIYCPVCTGEGKTACYRCNGMGGYSETSFVGSGMGDDGSNWVTRDTSCSICGGAAMLTCMSCGGCRYDVRVIY